MSYLDALRVSFSGDRARAETHVRDARRIAFQLIRQTADSGIGKARTSKVLPNGVKITIDIAGNQVSAHIEAPVAGDVGDRTLAYVATVGAEEKLLVVDVDKQVVLKSIVGLGGIVSVAAHPRGRYVFVVNTAGQVIKVDVGAVTAVGVSYPETPFVDMMISPDGERLHLRFRATGSPGAGGTYAGVYTLKTSDLSDDSFNPQQLFGSFSFRGAVHPKKPELLYLPVYGDGDGDLYPTGNPPSSDFDYVPEGIEVYDYHGGPMLAGELLVPYRVASANGFREIAFDGPGDRAYVCSSRDGYRLQGEIDITPQPTVIAYNTTGGSLTRINELLVGAQLTSCIAASRTTGYVYVAGKFDGTARVLRNKDDVFTEEASFPYRDPEAVGTEGPPNRCVQIGPRSGTKPDNRIFFLSYLGQSLWVFKEGSETPDKQISFAGNPTTMALGKVKLAAKGTPT